MAQWLVSKQLELLTIIINLYGITNISNWDCNCSIIVMVRRDDIAEIIYYILSNVNDESMHKLSII